MNIDMNKRMEKFFSPYVSLRKKRDRWYPNRINDNRFVLQFRSEIGIQSFGVPDERLDDFIRVASGYGFSVETILDK